MKKYVYNVEWIGDHGNAATTVIIEEADTDTAIESGERQMMELYGWDMEAFATVERSAELQYEEEA